MNGYQKNTPPTQRETVVISYYGRSFQFFRKTVVTTSKPVLDRYDEDSGEDMDSEGEDGHYEDSGEDIDNEGEDNHYEDSDEDMDNEGEVDHYEMESIGVPRG